MRRSDDQRAPWHAGAIEPAQRIETSFSGDAGHGTFSVIDFSLGGVPYQILDAGPAFALTEAVSISEVAAAAMAAMMKQKKIDIAAIEAAVREAV